ncbi:MAG: alpha/beta hydrolase [Anaerolineae bacterium]|nr:alpha/beta hydrolase [Anaerolineae bacterium]
MPYLDLPTGARLEYVDTAPDDSARPVMLAVHGMLGTARRHLGGLIDWLAADYRVLGPSMRGYGQSRPKPRDFPPDFYRRDTRDLLAFMDGLGIAQAHVLGFSDGGEIALMAAGQAPERFQSVIAWGAVGYFGPRVREVVTAPGYVQQLAPTPTEMTLHGLLDREAIAQAWIDAVLHLIDVEGGDVSLSSADRITAPLLMLLGRQDRLNPVEYAELYLERVGHGRLALFDCGHPIHREQPEAFRAAVGEFLAALRAE